ncbi:hypothetical protein BCR35DRAFT_115337 [Leucosporidium creatinivorum]|uniref:Uncharacterized protein n=1 Tax=Leucosporidium creatinivorum TaxID=106004 RepID=A0A1Y2F034_9BASI|nr:hypothetical protein BCR35DRAFT_115337 [Leucosporidium creatinivorum]
MNNSRNSNDNQFERLISSVEALRTHLGELPDLLAHRLRAEMSSEDPFAADSAAHHVRSTSAPPIAEQDHPQPDMDEDNGSVSTLVGQLEAQAEAQLDGPTAGEGGPRKVKFGVNPLSSFAQLDKKMGDSSDVYDEKGKLVRRGSASGAKQPRGPRMPGMQGLKIWGGPTPVSTAEHAARWGGGARSLSRAQDKAALDHALKDDEAARKPKHGPVVEAIKTDEGLAQALQNLAEGTGENEIDAGTMAIAVFEILQSMREISRKQKEQEEREKEEKAKNGGLSRREKAELEAKKEEIKRLEAIAGMGGSREAKLDQALSALQAKSSEQDTLLQKIAAAMEASKTPAKAEMDPALKEETKKLLGQVKRGVEDHVKDFRGQLTNEVQRMFKEVGKLRDEKKSLQTDIAELMSFQAKHGGSSSGGSAK